MPVEKYGRKNRNKSKLPCGDGQTRDVGSWYAGTSLAKEAAASIGTSDVLLCPCYAKANLVSKLILHPLDI